MSSALGSVHHWGADADDLSRGRAIASRLAKLPDYLEGASELVKRPVPLWRETAQSSVTGAPALFEAIRDPLAATHKIKPRRLDVLLENASSAFKQYGKRVARVAAGKPRDFSLGRERFEALMRERLGWDLTANEAWLTAVRWSGGSRPRWSSKRRAYHRASARAKSERAARRLGSGSGDLLSEYCMRPSA